MINVTCDREAYSMSEDRILVYVNFEMLTEDIFATIYFSSNLAHYTEI